MSAASQTPRPPPAERGDTARIELHFYPGHFPPTHVGTRSGAQLGPGLLVLLRGRTILYRTEAYGGPSKVLKDQDGGPDFTPTPAGRYLLLKPEPYTTHSWAGSEIAWGTPIKPSPTNPRDVHYLVRRKEGREVWGSLLKDFGFDRDKVETMYDALYGIKKLPTTWVFNAFGPIAFRFFQDTNRNGRLDGAEQKSGAMFHTTAENEAETAQGKVPEMTNSHGCIHLRPRDRDHLMSIGGLKKGVVFVVHPYEAKYVGPR
ncbi:MAG: hypothetical protein KA712_02710 [Myxococcales bacterium]|nr:hypothetical protein [Myxococcales bacterium]